MGDWYVDQNGKWAYDKNAPAADPTVTGMFPAVQARTVRYDEHEDHQLPQLRLEQDDLSDRDETAGEIVNTAKLGPLDEVLIQPPQDPEWRA